MANDVRCCDSSSASSIQPILSGLSSLSLRRLGRYLCMGGVLASMLLKVCAAHAQKVNPDGNGGPGWVQTFTNVSSSGSPSLYLAPVTFTVGVLPRTCGSYVPVTVDDNGTYLASVTLNSQGSGSYTTSSLSVGSHSITASFPGNYVNGTTCLSSDSNFNPVSQVVNSASPTISSTTPATGEIGAQGTINVVGNNLIDSSGGIFPSMTGGVIVSVASATSTQATIDYSIPANASPGSQTLTISNSLGTSNAAPFYVVPVGAADLAMPAYGDINTIAGNGIQGYTGDGGLPTSAEINHPVDVTVDGAGNIYFADALQASVRVVYSSGTVPNVSNPVPGNIYTVAGNGSNGYSGDGGPATSAELNNPDGIAVDTLGNIYIADWMNNRVRVVYSSGAIANLSNPTPGHIYTIAGDGQWGGNLGDGGSATAAEVYLPAGLALDSSGNLYIADSGYNRIRVVYVAGYVPNVQNPSYGNIYTVAGDGTANYNGDNQIATSAELNDPTDVKLDGYGNLYIVDSNNSRIREVTTSTGIINTIAGTGLNGYSGDGGSALNADLNDPTEVAVDTSGDVYICDRANNRIRKVANGNITTVAANGTQGYSGDGGPATSAELNLPTGVALDASQNIYIADSDNQRVRVVGGALTPSTFNPLYKVISLLYSPPGNKSSQGYSDKTTTGSTTTVGSSFTWGDTVTFSGGTPSGVSLPTSGNGTTGYSSTSTSAYAFVETFTNATTITTSDNADPNFDYGIYGQDGSHTPDALNHNLDEFVIWMNPLITFETNGDTPVSYSAASQPITINGEPAPYAIIYTVAASMMEAAQAGVTQFNPTGAAGVTTVASAWLVPRAYAQTNGPNAYAPGLGAVCASNALYQQTLAANLAGNPNPGYCTQSNQCGCTPADFATIVEMDPLLGYNPATHTSSPYSGTVSPLQADSLPTSSGPGSGPIACGLNKVASGSNCRYVVVPASTPTPATYNQNAVPETQYLNAGSYPTYTQDDSTTVTETIGGNSSYSVNLGFSFGPAVANLKAAGTWSWTDSESVGSSYGQDNSMFVTLQSSTDTCASTVSLFEDTMFHTFSFQYPTGAMTPAGGCN